MLSWDNWCWSAGAEGSAVIKERLSLNFFWKVFPQGQHIEAVFQKWPRLYLKLAVKLGGIWFWKFEGVMGWSVAGMESLNRVQERLLVKVQFHQGTPKVLKMPELWDGHQDSISGRMEPVGAAEARAGEVTQAPHRSPQDSKWNLDFGYCVNLNHTFGIWVFSVQIMTVSWFFLLEVRKYLIYFWLHSWEKEF